MASITPLIRHGAMTSIADKPGVFRQSTSSHLGDGWFPLLPPLLQLYIVHVRDIDAVLDGVDDDCIAVLHEDDGSSDCGLWGNVSNLRRFWISYGKSIKCESIILLAS